MSEGLADGLLRGCRQLLDELEAFSLYLKNAQEQAPKSKFEHVVDMKQFNGMVSTEMKSLEKVSFGKMPVSTTRVSLFADTMYDELNS